MSENMKPENKKLAIVLFNLGGPDKPDDIKPFLRNLFSDPAIISLPAIFRLPLAWLISTTRTPKAKPLYEIMGGASPLLENTKKQADAITKILEQSLENVNIKTFINMRYWHPFSKDIAQQINDFKPDDVVLLPLYPQYSTTTTGSSVKEFQKYYKNYARLIREYPTLDGLINANISGIEAEYEKIGSPDRARILFSAHGLPQKVIDAGDPYEKHVNLTANAIKAKLIEKYGDKFEYVVCYQSKVGPLKWLEPSTVTEIERAGRDKMPIIICPVAFVSDHIETLVELDVEYRELAHNVGVPAFGRSATVSDNPEFINDIAKLIIEKLGKNT